MRSIDRAEYEVQVRSEGGILVHDFTLPPDMYIERISVAALHYTPEGANVTLVLNSPPEGARVPVGHLTSPVVAYDVPQLAYALQCGLTSAHTTETLRASAATVGSPVDCDIESEGGSIDESVVRLAACIPAAQYRQISLAVDSSEPVQVGGLLLVRLLQPSGYIW